MDFYISIFLLFIIYKCVTPNYLWLTLTFSLNLLISSSFVLAAQEFVCSDICSECSGICARVINLSIGIRGGLTFSKADELRIFFSELVYFFSDYIYICV